MERGVEDGHLGDAGHEALDGADAEEVSRIVQRGEGAELLDFGLYVVVYEGAAAEVFASVGYAVPHRLDFGEG